MYKIKKIQVIYAYCCCLGWFGRSNPDWRLYYFLEQHNIHVGESMILTRYTNFWLNIAEKQQMKKTLRGCYIYILPWHLLGHAKMLVICFDLQFSRSTRPKTSFCIFIAYINTEGILFNVKITRWN